MEQHISIESVSTPLDPHLNNILQYFNDSQSTHHHIQQEITSLINLSQQELIQYYEDTNSHKPTLEDVQTALNTILNSQQQEQYSPVEINVLENAINSTRQWIDQYKIQSQDINQNLCIHLFREYLQQPTILYCDEVKELVNQLRDYQNSNTIDRDQQVKNGASDNYETTNSLEEDQELDQSKLSDVIQNDLVDKDQIENVINEQDNNIITEVQQQQQEESQQIQEDLQKPENNNDQDIQVQTIEQEEQQAIQQEEEQIIEQEQVVSVQIQNIIEPQENIIGQELQQNQQQILEEPIDQSQEQQQIMEVEYNNNDVDDDIEPEINHTTVDIQTNKLTENQIKIEVEESVDYQRNDNPELQQEYEITPNQEKEDIMQSQQQEQHEVISQQGIDNINTINSVEVQNKNPLLSSEDEEEQQGQCQQTQIIQNSKTQPENEYQQQEFKNNIHQDIYQDEQQVIQDQQQQLGQIQEYKQENEQEQENIKHQEIQQDEKQDIQDQEQQEQKYEQQYILEQVQENIIDQKIQQDECSIVQEEQEYEQVQKEQGCQEIQQQHKTTDDQSMCVLDILEDISEYICKRIQLVVDTEDLEIRKQAEQEIEQKQMSIQYILREETIQQLSEQVEQLQKWNAYITWNKQAQQYIDQIKGIVQQNPVKIQDINELVCNAEDLGTPQQFKTYDILIDLLINFNQIQNEITQFGQWTLHDADSISSQKYFIQQAKALLEEVKGHPLYQINSENFNKCELNEIQVNITKCDQWLENVIKFINENTQLIQNEEYIEDQMNIDSQEQQIRDLRDQAEGLQYTVEEGEQLLNDYEWIFKVKQLLVNKKSQQQNIDYWLDLYNYTHKTNHSQENNELIQQLYQYIQESKDLQKQVNQLKQQKNSKKIQLDELKLLTGNVFNFRIKLTDEINYLKDLLQLVQKTLESLDNLVKQDPKPNIAEVLKMLDQLKKLPIEAQDYENAIQNKISKAQNLANVLRNTQEVNTKTAEILLREYKQCNIFISDGYRLEKVYTEQEQQLQQIKQRIQAEQPLSYECITDIIQQVDNMLFDINNEVSLLKGNLYVLRLQCIRQSNWYAYTKQYQQAMPEIILSGDEMLIDMDYQVSDKPIIISYELLKMLILQGYYLQQQSQQNILLTNSVKFIEWLGNKVQEYIHRIYKIKSYSQLQGVNQLCCGFIDCSHIIQEHKSNLLSNSKNYIPPTPEKIVLHGSDMLQAVSSINIPVYILNKQSINTSSINNSQLEIENNHKQDIIQSDILKKRSKLSSIANEELSNGNSTEEDAKGKIHKKMKIQQDNKFKYDTNIKYQNKQQTKYSDEEIIKKQDITPYMQNQQKIQEQQQMLKKPNKNMSKESQIIRNELVQTQIPNSTEKRKIQQEQGNNNKEILDDQISENIRSHNIGRIKTFLEKCKYLKQSTSVAKSLENQCYQKTSNNKRLYTKFIEGVLKALNNIKKMKYICLYLVEDNYAIEFLLKYREMDLDTLIKNNDKRKEDVIQKRLKKPVESLQPLIQKRNHNTKSNITTPIKQADQINKKIKRDYEQFQHQIKKSNSKQQNIQERQISLQQSEEEEVEEDDFDNSRQSNIQQEYKVQRKSEKKPKLKSTQFEEDILLDNFEPIQKNQFKFNKQQQQPKQQQQQQQSRRNTNDQENIKKKQQQQKQSDNEILQIYEGMMKFSSRSCTKVNLLTTCFYYDLIKIPQVQCDEKEPLISESSMTLEAFSQYIEELLQVSNEDRDEVIVCGWIQTTLDLYSNMSSTLADELLTQNLVGFTEYTEHTSIYFLHKRQIQSYWKADIDNITKRSDPQFDSLLYYFIISKDYRYSTVDYPKLQILSFNGKYTQKKTSRNTSRNTSRSPSPLPPVHTNTRKSEKYTPEEKNLSKLISKAITTYEQKKDNLSGNTQNEYQSYASQRKTLQIKLGSTTPYSKNKLQVSRGDNTQQNQNDEFINYDDIYNQKQSVNNKQYSKYTIDKQYIQQQQEQQIEGSTSPTFNGGDFEYSKIQINQQNIQQQQQLQNTPTLKPKLDLNRPLATYQSPDYINAQKIVANQNDNNQSQKTSVLKPCLKSNVFSGDNRLTSFEQLMQGQFPIQTSNESYLNEKENSISFKKSTSPYSKYPISQQTLDQTNYLCNNTKMQSPFKYSNTYENTSPNRNLQYRSQTTPLINDIQYDQQRENIHKRSPYNNRNYAYANEYDVDRGYSGFNRQPRPSLYPPALPPPSYYAFSPSRPPIQPEYARRIPQRGAYGYPMYQDGLGYDYYNY